MELWEGKADRPDGGQDGEDDDEREAPVRWMEEAGWLTVD